MKKICWILIAVICISFIPCFAEADEMPEVCLYDTFEGIQAGRHPLYKDGYWTGDTLKINYCGYLDVVNTPDSKKLRIHTLGAGEEIGSVGPMIYADVSLVQDDMVLEADITIEDEIAVAAVQMRGVTASHLVELVRFEGGNIITEGSVICAYEPGKEYHVTVEMDAQTKTMRVSVDDITVEDIQMGAPLISGIQTFRFGITGSSEKGVECGYLIDNVYLYKASERVDHSVFSKLPQNLGLNDWSDLTKFMKNNITLVRGSRNATVGIDRVQMDTPVYFEGENVYAPIKFVMESLDIPYAYANGRAQITIDSRPVTLNIGEGLRLINAKPYVSLRYLTDFGGLYLTVKNNTAVFGRHPIFFNNASQAKEIEDYVNNVPEETKEEKEWFPDKEEIAADFAENTEGVHPRVLATKDDFDRIRELIKTDSVAAAWYEEIKKQAELCLTQPPYTFRTTDGIRMDVQTVLSRFEALGLVYNIEGGEKYFKKAYEDMKTIVEYETWKDDQFILCANMIEAMAIAYDWFYHAMTPEERKLIAEGIYRLGLKHALNGYRRETLPGATNLETRSKLQWLNDSSNWVAVGNAGAVMGAVALYDEYPEECNEVIWSALQSMENFYVTTEPDGGNTEGAGYWHYATIHYINFVAVLNSALGTDYGRYKTGGIDKLGYFPVYMQNEVSSFAFSDSSASTIYTPLYMYFALRNNDNSLGYYRRNMIVNNLSAPTVYDLLWYRDSFSKPDGEMELDYYFRNVESGSFRDAFNNDFSTFFAFHGGSNTANHSHVDSGTWCMNAHGKQWFLDLGKDQLTYANLNGINFTADQLYRIRAEGHNCIVFNPDLSTGQAPDYASVESFHSDDEGGFAIMDLTRVYRDYVTDYKRGFMLTDDRTRAIVQDKFTAKKPSEFWWFAHTPAAVEISPDGKRAILTQADRKLAVYLSSTDSSLKLGVMEAKPLPTSPNIVGRADDSAYRKLYIHGEDVTELEFAVSMVPIITGESIPRTAFGLVPLNKWRIKNRNTNPPRLETLMLGTEPIADFNPRCYEYSVNVPYEQEEIPEVTATAEEGFDVSVKSYERNLNPVREIKVINKNTCEDRTYYVTFIRCPTIEIPTDITELVPVSVTASEIPQPEYPPEQVLDNDLSNEKRWSAEGDQHLIFDLGEELDVDSIAIAFYKGNERLSKFEVYTSSDGEDYELVLDTYSSRLTDSYELHRLKASKARYVKLQLHGAGHITWNSIKEVKLY